LSFGQIFYLISKIKRKFERIPKIKNRKNTSNYSLLPIHMRLDDSFPNNLSILKPIFKNKNILTFQKNECHFSQGLNENQEP